MSVLNELTPADRRAGWVKLMVGERTTLRALAIRACALLRDDAHRSRQTRDGSRRYDAWREQRDALIREVEG